MCENADDYASAMKEVTSYTPAPRGRPPHAYRFVCGGWRHVETGETFNSEWHATGVALRKATCMYRNYWKGGGREKRLARYTKRRKPSARQQTLPELQFAKEEQNHG